MKKHLFILILLLLGLNTYAQTVVHIDDPKSWKNTSLKDYQGAVVRFDCPMVVVNNQSNGSLTVAPHRIFTPTNQVVPGTMEYHEFVALNNAGNIRVSGIYQDPIHRTGERIHNLTIQVDKDNPAVATFVSGTFVGNTRADMLQLAQDRFEPYISAKGEPNLLVCAMNCEYYLPNTWGEGYGPNNKAEHEDQIKKVIGALAAIDADLYGLIEVQLGYTSVQEIATLLHERLGHEYGYQNTTDLPGSGSYTGAGILWRKDKLRPIGPRVVSQAEVKNRKHMQCFEVISGEAQGEQFIYSINHFKSKSGSGTGLDANQGDGQGSFNNARIHEAKDVYSEYATLSRQLGEQDILLMGDLNAYAMEDPIRELTRYGMRDLHRVFHADSSYSYTFGGQAGYLDHAIASPSMTAQVTGMLGFHINSDENDNYTYNGRTPDTTPFRCSDHDPVIVGLHLDKSLIPANTSIYVTDYYRIVDIFGHIVDEGEGNPVLPSNSGIYVIYRYCQKYNSSTLKSQGLETTTQRILIP